MNKKGGVFSVTIGAMAVALIALTFFSAQSALYEEESEDYLAVIADVKAVWHNTVLVMDDAFAHAATAEGCTLQEFNLEANYLDRAVTSINSALEPGVDCSYSGTLAGAGPLTYSATVTCERMVEVGGRTKFSAMYEKDVSFSAPCVP